ncbi:MAG TPA: hypothetical protein PKI20_15920 [Verrucomicrobiota bacterium]|jgi:hypothetical protein|nr:hypothetical protein [Verrucomicrobiota bacterium]HQL79266.1 hypothetical protein [Verrucomicrobiota bacterium]
MGLLKLFAKPAPTLLRLPSGSFTVDREGTVLTGTLPSSFPANVVKDIARQVLATFGEAAAAQLPLAELIINYPSLKISARELRGGAIVFLAPKAPASPMSLS